MRHTSARPHPGRPHSPEAHNAARPVPVLLRTKWGLPLLTVGSSVGGAVVVALLIVLGGAPHRFGAQLGTLLQILAVYVVVALLAAVHGVLALRRRSLGWLDTSSAPTPDHARHTLRLPTESTVLIGSLWTGGILAMSGSAFALLPVWEALGGTLLMTLGGLATVGYNYLFVERALRPVMATILAVDTPHAPPRTSVISRLILTWALTSALPLAAAIALLHYPDAAPPDRIRAATYLAALGLVSGALAETLLARAVAQPIHQMRGALRRIGQGRLDVRVPVDDSSEIGVLQSTVNDMVRGLQEQDRLRDLFGRHVGRDVAQRALDRGADLTGEIREITALFVDVTNSTALAHQISPQEFVDKLNRLLAEVIAATESHHGLVNKFEGDAALCIFGAPVARADAADSALHAARQIRDRVLAHAELDIGIGLATGPVFAGNLGTDQRLEYTVIGDAVNETSRLTELAKHTPERILASDAVIRAASEPEREYWTPHGDCSLKGRTLPTQTWESIPPGN